MSVQFAVSTTDNIHFTGMTCFPLQFSRLARTSIRRSVALVRSGPPLETAIAPLRGRRKDRQRRRQSSLSVMNAGDQACPETRPCPHPSPGDRKPARTLAGKADGTDVLLGNVEFQHRHAAQLNTHANSYAERWVRSVKEECLSRLILFGESSLRRALQQYLEHYHGERNHQGKDNRILFPSRPEIRMNMGTVRCRERLGGLLKYYEREAA